MDDQTISHFPELAALDVDEAAADVCRRCSEIPWANGPQDSNSVEIESFSRNCRICRLLKSCAPKFYEDYMRLTWEPAPEEVQKQLGKHNFKHNIIRAHEYEEDEYGDFVLPTLLVSDLSLEKAETASQLLVSPVVSLSKTGDHIQNCVKNHSHTCALEEDLNPLYLRVIDCDTRTIIDAPTGCVFVALSYVWGEFSASVETELSQDIPLTVEHSIYVTVKLGFRYLWVDRYCINQKDQQHKKDQINQMSTIYSAAHLTIISAAGSDPTHGLPGIALHARPDLSAYHERSGSLCLSAFKADIYRPWVSLALVAESVWASRAWTYQEAMYSRRRLIFTENQTIFSCNKNTYFEYGMVRPNGFMPNTVPWYNLVHKPGDSRMQRTLESMKQYCRRKLTYESDALAAISGTLNLLLDDDYLHLWGVPGRIPISIGFDREKHQPAHQPSSPREVAHMSDGLVVELNLSWNHPWCWNTKSIRRLGFPSWSPLGWSPGAISWNDGLVYIGRISFHTSLGQRDISKYLQYVRTDHTEIPQYLSLSLHTAIVEVYERGVIALLLDSRLQVITNVLWDGFESAEGTFLKAAVVAEDDGHIFLLFLEATSDDIYERRGSCFLVKQTWTEMVESGPMAGLNIWRDDSEEKRSSHKRDDGGAWTFIRYLDELDPADQERLRTSYGDLETWPWWGDLQFSEERIILG